MSVNVMNRVWGLQLPLTEKMVLITIADLADDDGRAWPSFGFLEERCCMSRRAVINAVKALIAKGIIAKEGRKRENGSYSSNSYIVIYDADTTAVTSVQDTPPLVNVVHHPGECGAPPLVHHVHPPSAPRAPLDPLKDPKNKKPFAAPKTGAAKPSDQSDQVKRKRAEHSWFVCWFAWACMRLSGAKYVVTKADAGITQRLLSSLGFEETLNRACYYLTLPEKDRWPRGAPTLRGFAHQINAIAGKDSDESDRKAIALGILPADMNLPAFTPWKTPCKEEAAA